MRLTKALPLIVLAALARAALGQAEPPAPATKLQTPSRPHVWFPAAPSAIGNWTRADKPAELPPDGYGDMPTAFYLYTNPFADTIEVEIISAMTVTAYQQPKLLISGYGYEKRALTTVYPFGPDRPVRAVMLTSLSTKQRVIMYGWVQGEDGSTSVDDVPALQQKFMARAADKPVRIAPCCIVRAYAFVYPSDSLGRLARRNLDTVCKGLYQSLKQNGAGASTPAETAVIDPRTASDYALALNELLAQFPAWTEGGSEMAYLATPETSVFPNQATDNLLPLKAGNFWQMRTQCDGKVSQDRLTVAGRATPPSGVRSTEVDITAATALSGVRSFTPPTGRAVFF